MLCVMRGNVVEDMSYENAFHRGCECYAVSVVLCCVVLRCAVTRRCL